MLSQFFLADVAMVPMKFPILFWRWEVLDVLLTSIASSFFFLRGVSARSGLLLLRRGTDLRCVLFDDDYNVNANFGDFAESLRE